MNKIIETISAGTRAQRTEFLIVLLTMTALSGFMSAQVAADLLTRGLFRVYFLDVGQGDSQLFVFPGGVNLLIDGGPDDRKVLHEITKALGPFSRRIDIVLNTHPQLDHFGGLIDVLERYRVSAFVSNGVPSKTASYLGLVAAVKASGSARLTLQAGDRIRYGDSVVEILNPVPAEYSPKDDVNETSIVSLIESNRLAILTTGDIGAQTEHRILTRAPQDIRKIAVLKVPHHGSKNSSDEKFLKAVSPKIAVIQVGKNSYGHPHPSTIQKLEKTGAVIYRNDLDGTVKITSDGERVRTFIESRRIPRGLPRG